MSREAPFQDRLRDIIQSVISRYKFDGLEFSRVERDFPVDARKPDITVFDRIGNPFLLIEAKKEVGPSRLKFISVFRPHTTTILIIDMADLIHEIVTSFRSAF